MEWGEGMSEREWRKMSRHVRPVMLPPCFACCAAAALGFINFGVAPDIADAMASAPEDRGTVVVVGAGCSGGQDSWGGRRPRADMAAAAPTDMPLRGRAQPEPGRRSLKVNISSQPWLRRLFAGLAAARQLRMLGYRVVVVEGRDRPGGRVHTKRMEVRFDCFAFGLATVGALL